MNLKTSINLVGGNYEASVAVDSWDDASRIAVNGFAPAYVDAGGRFDGDENDAELAGVSFALPRRQILLFDGFPVSARFQPEDGTPEALETANKRARVWRDGFVARVGDALDAMLGTSTGETGETIIAIP